MRTTKTLSNYIQREYKKGPDIGECIRELQAFNLAEPEEPEDPNSQVEFEKWRNSTKLYGIKKEATEEGLKRAYAIIYNQCSYWLKTRLEGADGYAAVKNDQDVIELLKLIHGIACQFDDNWQGVYVLAQAKKLVYTLMQEKGVSNDRYLEEFEAAVNVVETYGGAFGHEPGLIEAKLEDMTLADPDNPTNNEREQARLAVREQFLASLFLSGANHTRYRKLKDDLSNNYVKGDDNYPKTLERAVTLLNN